MMLLRNSRKRKNPRLNQTYRFGDDRRERAAVRDAGRRRAEEEAAAAAAVAAKPREAREAEAGVADNADAATLLLASDAATATVLLRLLRRAASEAAPAPVEPNAIAARIATGAVLRDAKREPERRGERAKREKRSG